MTSLVLSAEGEREMYTFTQKENNVSKAGIADVLKQLKVLKFWCFSDLKIFKSETLSQHPLEKLKERRDQAIASKETAICSSLGFSVLPNDTLTYGQEEDWNAKPVTTRSTSWATVVASGIKKMLVGRCQLLDVGVSSNT